MNRNRNFPIHISNLLLDDVDDDDDDYRMLHLSQMNETETKNLM